MSSLAFSTTALLKLSTLSTQEVFEKPKKKPLFIKVIIKLSQMCKLILTQL